jgi:hypothetical protein
MSEDFSGSCDVASRNPLIHDGATNGTNSPCLDAEGVALRRYRVLTAASDGSLATANFRESLFFLRRWVNKAVSPWVAITSAKERRTRR